MTATYIYDHNGNRIAVDWVLPHTSKGVPIDPENTDYQEIMRLVDAGELTIQEPE